jgi:hypothetical protein
MSISRKDFVRICPSESALHIHGLTFLSQATVVSTVLHGPSQFYCDVISTSSAETECTTPMCHGPNDKSSAGVQYILQSFHNIHTVS